MNDFVHLFYSFVLYLCILCWNLSLQELEGEFELEDDEGEVIQFFNVQFYSSYSLGKSALHSFLS